MKKLVLIALLGLSSTAFAAATLQPVSHTPAALTEKVSAEDKIGEDDKGILEDAKKGDAGAQFFLGFESLKKKQDEVAFEWLEKAAKQDHPRAEFYLGYMYMMGRGVKQNTKEGMEWVEKAARLGSEEAQYVMALAYIEGKGGVDKDNTKAFAWMTVSADQKYAPAVKDLKKMKKLLSKDEVKKGKELAVDIKK